MQLAVKCFFVFFLRGGVIPMREHECVHVKASLNTSRKWDELLTIGNSEQR